MQRGMHMCFCSVAKEMVSPVICKAVTILGIVCAHVHGITILGILPVRVV